MAENEEEWSDCEENIVVVEVQGIMVQDFLSNVEKARFLGIDTESPYLQLDDNTFTGTYQDAMGTCLLFQNTTDDNAEGTDSDEEDLKLEYSCKTHKKLYMQRVFMKPNVEKKKTLNNLGAQTMDSQDPSGKNTEKTECVEIRSGVSPSKDCISTDQVTETNCQSGLTQCEESKAEQSNLQPDTESGVVVQGNKITEESSKGELTNESEIPGKLGIEHCDNGTVKSDVSNVSQDKLESQVNLTQNEESGQSIHIENT